jgi:Skp family chaperone for outer membrane proteins
MMKKFILVNILLLAAGITVFAQQSGERPTSAQTRENAARLLQQTRTNASQFESTYNDLNSRNSSNNDSVVFNQLKADIERLEASINTEQGRIRATLDSGSRVSPEIFQRVQRLMNQHRQKMTELEAFSNDK